MPKKVLLLVYVRVSELRVIFRGLPALENYVAQKKKVRLENFDFRLTRLKNNLHARDRKYIKQALTAG